MFLFVATNSNAMKAQLDDMTSSYNCAYHEGVFPSATDVPKLFLFACVFIERMPCSCQVPLPPQKYSSLKEPDFELFCSQHRGPCRKRVRSKQILDPTQHFPHESAFPFDLLMNSNPTSQIKVAVLDVYSPYWQRLWARAKAARKSALCDSEHP